jgi:sugar-specific transcriptional regulator TrmB
MPSPLEPMLSHLIERTSKRLKNQLREAQDTIIQLREEQREHMKDAFKIINQCHEAIDNNKRMVERSLPLRRQLKHIY